MKRHLINILLGLVVIAAALQALHWLYEMAQQLVTYTFYGLAAAISLFIAYQIGNLTTSSLKTIRRWLGR